MKIEMNMKLIGDLALDVSLTASLLFYFFILVIFSRLLI